MDEISAKVSEALEAQKKAVEALTSLIQVLAQVDVSDMLTVAEVWKKQKSLRADFTIKLKDMGRQL
jgi:Asp-tRNA(Asn)/Glu-tRNA(Gln) amidotransferase C subunit